MYEGILQELCEREGCCFDINASPNYYYSNAEGMLIFGAETSQKLGVFIDIAGS